MTNRWQILSFIAAAGCAAAAHAAVIRVGPGGDVATIQAGIDAAVATGADDQLHVRAGTYAENVVISPGSLGGALEISGGWDAAFAGRDPDPSSTVVDGGGTGRAFFGASLTSGSLTLRGITFRNGRALDTDSGGATGAGLYITAIGIPVLVEDCRLHLNQASSASGVLGAGAAGGFVLAATTANVELHGLEVDGNATEVTDTIGAVVGAGLRVIGQGTAVVDIAGSSFRDNVTTGPGQQRGAGLALEGQGSSQIAVADCELSGNHGSGASDGAALSATSLDASAIDLRRILAIGNRRDAADASSQVYLRCLSAGDCSFRFSDSVVARGGTGLVAQASSGTLDLVNLTLADHLEFGASGNVMPPGLASFDNSIAWGNALGDVSLFGGGFTTQANLIGVDPRFVAPAAGNYRVSIVSPALDAGTATPTGGLSTLALGGVPRLSGPAPDQGAYELEEIFADGFESGDTSAWSSVTP